MQHDGSNDCIMNSFSKNSSLLKNDGVKTCISLSTGSTHSPATRRLSAEFSHSTLPRAAPSVCNDLKVDSTMPHATASCSYFNSQTGTSITHVGPSGSPANSRVREYSDYVDKQWAILKEKMMQTQSCKDNSKFVNKESFLSGFVEEKCEVDFSYIDEPVGSEPEDSIKDIKFRSVCGSKSLPGEPIYTFSKSSPMSTSSTSFNSFVKDQEDKCVELQSVTSHRVSPHGGIHSEKGSFMQCLPEKDSQKWHPTSTTDNLKNRFAHSMERTSFYADSVVQNPCVEPSIQTSRLVPSFKDEFLSGLNSVSSACPEKSSLKSKQPNESQTRHSFSSTPVIRQEDKFSETSKVSSGIASKVPPFVLEDRKSLPISSDVANNNTSDVQHCFNDGESGDNNSSLYRLEGMKSRRYQEMHSRKNLKEKLKKSNTITSNQVPNYKGDSSLDEIINFINKDAKDSANISLAKSSKKSKKKLKESSKKYNSLNLDDVSREKESNEDNVCSQLSKDDDRMRNDKNETACDVTNGLQEEVRNDVCFSGSKNKDDVNALIGVGEEKNNDDSSLDAILRSVVDGESKIKHQTSLMSQSAVLIESKVDVDLGMLRTSFSDCETFSVVQKRKKAKSKSSSSSESPNVSHDRNSLESKCSTLSDYKDISGSEKSMKIHNRISEFKQKTDTDSIDDHSCKRSSDPANKVSPATSHNHMQGCIGELEPQFLEETCKNQTSVTTPKQVQPLQTNSFDRSLEKSSFLTDGALPIEVSNKISYVQKKDNALPPSICKIEQDNHISPRNLSQSKPTSMNLLCNDKSHPMTASSTVSNDRTALVDCTHIINDSRNANCKVVMSSQGTRPLLINHANRKSDDSELDYIPCRKSRFNLRNAQAYLYSVFQQVIESKDHISYSSEDERRKK